MIFALILNIYVCNLISYLKIILFSRINVGLIGC
jgi:hypothetical protein